ncbi:MAG: undecaprenyl-diphosphate phosphatase [Thermotogae bacterium]|nr:undecaprenyl-diphosphate phosphatase [Thermotogota bacterium]
MEKLILGVIQGVTEFLPVSSSGHLVLLKHLIGFRSEGAFYEVFLHSATFLSVVFVLRHSIFSPEVFLRYLKLSFVATLPLVLVVPFASSIERTFDEPRILPFTFLFTTIVLLSTRFLRIGNRKARFYDAFILGILQTLALLPGVSRSGITISSGLWRRLSPDESFTLSFWMFLPAALGSFIFEAPKVKDVSLSPWDGVVWIITFATGVLSLQLLRRLLVSEGRFWVFGVYTLTIAIVTVFLFY